MTKSNRGRPPGPLTQCSWCDASLTVTELRHHLPKCTQRPDRLLIQKFNEAKSSPTGEKEEKE